MDAVFRKNESETNEITAKLFLALYVFVLLIVVCCYTGIFDISRSMIGVTAAVSTIPLLLPAVLVYVLHIRGGWMKYLLITMLSIVIGVWYCVFTFQAIIVFVVPSIVAACYMDRRLLNYSGMLTCVMIFVSHAVTGVYLFQPWIEPFVDMRSILQYGALPRCMQYLLCFGLLVVLNRRHLNYMEKLHLTLTEERQREGQGGDNRMEQHADEAEFRRLLGLLTDREREVFLLMVSGCTNMQIAERLCLSMGTVKNYVSTIYDKIETKERNYIIMKYSRFLAGYDQSNSRL